MPVKYVDNKQVSQTYSWPLLTPSRLYWLELAEMIQTLATLSSESPCVFIYFRGILGVLFSAPEQMDGGWLWGSRHGVRAAVEVGITTSSNLHPEEAHLEYSLMP